MKIYIKTPLLDNSQTVPHMVEHCLRRSLSLNPQWFFEKKLPYEQWIQGEWTYVICDQQIDSEDLIKEIKMPLVKQVYLTEKTPFKEELMWVSRWSQVFEAMLQKIVDPKIVLNSWKGKNWDVVNFYHKKYFQEENFLVFDENVEDRNEYNFIFCGKNVQEENSSINRKFSLIFNFNNTLILGYQGYDLYHYWFLIFSWVMLENYCSYFQRYQLGIYYYEITVLDHFRDYMWITTPNIDYSGLDLIFFEKWKSYFIWLLRDFWFKEKLFFWNYMYWVPATRQEVIALCESFSWNYFQKEVLTPLNEMKKGA